MSSPASLLPFQSINFTTTAPGKRLMVTGAVHGNEVAGTHGIRRVVAEIERGELALARGSVTFVPITNPKAYALKRRNGDRNLNRNLTPTDTPTEFEDHIANWLCPLFARHDALDAHPRAKAAMRTPLESAAAAGCTPGRRATWIG